MAYLLNADTFLFWKINLNFDFSILPRMKYELASSSTEEGEIKEVTFPYHKSYVQYYYYPQTTRFIGRNSVPHIMNYRNDGMTQRLKKEIKADYPYISFSYLDDNKAFFQNKFEFVADLCPVEKPLSLLSIKTDYKEIKKPLRKITGESRFERFFHKFFFSKEEMQLLAPKDCTKLFAFEDRILEALDKSDAFIFFRTCEELVAEKRTKKYAFEDIFYNGASFYEYLEIYAEVLVKDQCSEETRNYVAEDAMILIHSSTVFKEEGVLKRLYGGPDFKKNAMVIFNKECASISGVQERYNENIKYIMGIDLPEGDYVINQKKIYKVSKEGIQFEFKGISYDNFIKID